MDAIDPPRRPGWALRVTVFIGLLAVAALLLPVSAFAVEGFSGRAENFILPVQLVLMVLLGGAVGALLGRVGRQSTAVRAVLGWAVLGLVAAAMADTVWFALLAG